jgi:hypothetical protein
MARTDYTIPVKIRIETGRYKYGYVKSLTPDERGNLRIMYGKDGKLSSRAAEGVIHEPLGFEPMRK